MRWACRFRPHVKTSKCLDVVRQQRDAGARGITVSTLKEAEEFFDGGFDDIFYAVAMAPNKVQRALALQARGCKLRLVVDSLAGAEAVLAAGAQAGIRPRVRSKWMLTGTARACTSSHLCSSRSARACNRAVPTCSA